MAKATTSQSIGRRRGRLPAGHGGHPVQSARPSNASRMTSFHACSSRTSTSGVPSRSRIISRKLWTAMPATRMPSARNGAAIAVRSATASSPSKRMTSTIPSAPVMELVRLESLETELLTADLEQEPGVVDQVAAPQPARLLLKPEEPLESRSHHPAWRLRHSTGMKIEGRAHPDEHRRAKRRAHARHPEILLRCAHSYPNDIGLRPVDDVSNFDGAELLRGPKGGRAGADDLDPGKPPAHDSGQFIGHARHPAVQVVPVARGQRVLHRRQHEIGAVDP